MEGEPGDQITPIATAERTIMTTDTKADEPPFKIKIDKVKYEAPAKEMTGRELRDLVTPAIPETRDLWEELPGDDDRKIADDYKAEIWNDKIFYTSPSKINPGV
jgi:hypothetical protein